MRTTYAARYTKVGGSEGVIVPHALRRELQLQPGDLMLMVRYGTLLIMKRATPGMVIDRDQIPSDALPGPHPASGSNG